MSKALEKYLKNERRTNVGDVVMETVTVFEENGEPSIRALCYLLDGRSTFPVIDTDYDPRPGTYYYVNKTDLKMFEEVLAQESRKFNVQFTLDDARNRKDDEEAHGVIRRFYRISELTSPLVD